VRSFTALLLAVAPLVGAVGAVAATARGEAPVGTLRLVALFDRDEVVFQDFPPPGDSPGDQNTYAQELFDAANRRRVGYSLFVATHVDRRLSGNELRGTLFLARGTIELAGATLARPVPGIGRVNPAGDLAVVGGTGAYAGARGTYRQQRRPFGPVTSRGGRYRVTIRFVR
jgi:hypothetical protein